MFNGMPRVKNKSVPLKFGAASPKKKKARVLTDREWQNKRRWFLTTNKLGSQRRDNRTGTDRNWATCMFVCGDADIQKGEIIKADVSWWTFRHNRAPSSADEKILLVTNSAAMRASAHGSEVAQIYSRKTHYYKDSNKTHQFIHSGEISRPHDARLNTLCSDAVFVYYLNLLCKFERETLRCNICQLLLLRRFINNIIPLSAA